MPSFEKCCQCLNHFSMSKLPRKLPSCPHSICEPCLKQIIDFKLEIIICGFCSSSIVKEDISIFPLNTAELLSLSQVSVLQQPQIIQEENQLLSDLLLIETSNPKPNQQQLTCLTHEAILDIVCITDKQKICTHCALFGNHRNHRIKPLEDFQIQVDEKCNTFKEIQSKKQSFMDYDIFNVYQQINNIIELKRASLRQEIETQYSDCINKLTARKENAFQQVEQICSEIQRCVRTNQIAAKYDKSKDKFDKWEQNCQSVIALLNRSKLVEQKLNYFYDSPLQIISQGFVFLEQIGNNSRQLLDKLNLLDQDIQLQTSNNQFEGFFSLRKKSLASNSPQKIDQQIEEANPFLDCTSSEIMLTQHSALNSTALQAQISAISKLKARQKGMSSKNQHFKLMKSIDKGSRNISSLFDLKKVTSTPRMIPCSKRPTSGISSLKSTPKINKHQSTKEMSSECQISASDSKQPQQIYLQFSKNTLTDVFDICGCNLPSDKVVEYVHRARRIHKIKGLKLSNNRLNSIGFEKMTQYLQGVSNINLSNNNINEGIFEVILKYRESLESLKIINLSHNPITFDRKASMKCEEVKKKGIIVIL